MNRQKAAGVRDYNGKDEDEGVFYAASIIAELITSLSSGGVQKGFPTNFQHKGLKKLVPTRLFAI